MRVLVPVARPKIAVLKQGPSVLHEAVPSRPQACETFHPRIRPPCVFDMYFAFGKLSACGTASPGRGSSLRSDSEDICSTVRVHQAKAVRHWHRPCRNPSMAMVLMVRHGGTYQTISILRRRHTQKLRGSSPGWWDFLVLSKVRYIPLVLTGKCNWNGGCCGHYWEGRWRKDGGVLARRGLPNNMSASELGARFGVDKSPTRDAAISRGHVVKCIPTCASGLHRL